MREERQKWRRVLVVNVSHGYECSFASLLGHEPYGPWRSCRLGLRPRRPPRVAVEGPQGWRASPALPLRVTRSDAGLGMGANGVRYAKGTALRLHSKGALRAPRPR
jgi:hypothetical protein